PSETEATTKPSRDFLQHADLVCARDRISYENLTAVAGEQEKIRIYPDFTNLVQGVVPTGFDTRNQRFCLIPNHRMVDKTNSATATAYLPLLVAIASHLKARNAGPFLLVHGDEGDRRLAEQVSEAAGGIPIVEEPDPLAIKGILGTCRGSVSSRFHGLVSALSQGVPSLATSWSHKYEMLFADYGISEGVLEVNSDHTAVRRKLDALLDPATADGLRGQLLERSAAIKQEAEKMWQAVFAVAGSPAAGESPGAHEPTANRPPP
ncbi:MAG: polysaccharide pyruvyl transferase family protein, partial [Ectothiorhodospiraceae bacterium]|nr:polysaccharide pyruvyl transferase family protein [Ectothiorhodospiraceae bacterium]